MSDSTEPSEGTEPRGEESGAEAPEEPADAGEGEAAEPDFWQRQRKLTYPLFAAVVLPPLFCATLFLLYRDFDRLVHDPLPGSTAMSEPASAIPRSPEPRQAPPRAATSAEAPVTAASAFAEIYREASWAADDAGVGTSGLGSTVEATALYRAYLQAFLKEHKIKSVVDAGCGDWEFSRVMDWSGVDYKGYDVVESVIAKNKQRYESANVHFFTADVVTDELPAADLLLVKHVLQHLPNDDVTKFMGKMGNYKHILVTDTVHPRTMSGSNRDIAVGDFRTFDPTAPPFSLPGVKALTWWDGHHMQQVVHFATKRE
ncbi:MAG: class I SAM-dependent methyltransferase [Labilithrix sp.]|nr:class I SAM-dependent methyltransferase [Labilithrix sp.]